MRIGRPMLLVPTVIGWLLLELQITVLCTVNHISAYPGSISRRHL